MKEVAFVILNYKTYNDTINLIKNLSEQIWFEEIGIFVVENGSANESVKKLTEFKKIIGFNLIISNENLGFANGNNLGISKAQEANFETVICSNSDITIKKQENFLKIIKNVYSLDNKIAIIAPNIINQDNIAQNPFRRERFTQKEILKIKLFYLSGFYQVYYFLRIYIVYSLITYLAKQKKRTATKMNFSTKNKSDYIYAPHGSFLIFTPTFFTNFKGFDENTFLYCEEFILSENIFEKKLKIYYENSIEIFHNESSSTNEIVNNYKEKVKFTLKHTFASCKYFSEIIKL